MEFYRHLLHPHEKVWCKKGDTTYKLPITIWEQQCTSWHQITMMKVELTYYKFIMELAIENYELEGVINEFYNKTWQTEYPHRSIGRLEWYKNVWEMEQIRQINLELAVEDKISQLKVIKKKKALQEENAMVKVHPLIILKKNPPIPFIPPGISPSMRLSQGQSGQYATLIVQLG